MVVQIIGNLKKNNIMQYFAAKRIMYVISFTGALFCRSSNRFLLLDAMLVCWHDIIC